MHSIPIREESTLAGECVVYAKYTGLSKLHELDGIAQQINTGNFVCLYATQDRDRFSRKTGAPLEALVELFGAPEDTPFIHGMTVYKSEQAISKAFLEEDLYSLGEISDLGEIIKKSRADAAEYFSGLFQETQVEVKSGLGPKLSQVTYKNITPEEFRDYVMREYVTPMINCARRNQPKVVGRIGEEFKRFSMDAPFAEYVSELCNVITKGGKNPDMELIESYVGSIADLNLAIKQEDYERAVAIRDILSNLASKTQLT